MKVFRAIYFNLIYCPFYCFDLHARALCRWVLASSGLVSVEFFSFIHSFFKKKGIVCFIHGIMYNSVFYFNLWFSCQKCYKIIVSFVTMNHLVSQILLIPRKKPKIFTL